MESFHSFAQLDTVTQAMSSPVTTHSSTHCRNGAISQHQKQALENKWTDTEYDTMTNYLHFCHTWAINNNKIEMVTMRRLRSPA